MKSCNLFSGFIQFKFSPSFIFDGYNLPTNPRYIPCWLATNRRYLTSENWLSLSSILNFYIITVNMWNTSVNWYEFHAGGVALHHITFRLTRPNLIAQYFTIHMATVINYENIRSVWLRTAAIQMIVSQSRWPALSDLLKINFTKHNLTKHNIFSVNLNQRKWNHPRYR